MSRLLTKIVFVAAALLAFGVGSSIAHAQQPGQGPPLPLAVDLAKVPVGSWADYDVTMAQIPPMTTRMALVGKAANGDTIEMRMQGGMMAGHGDKMVMQMTLPPGAEKQDKGGAEHAQKVVMQIGSNDPMEMPLALAQQQKHFTKPDPKKLVGAETVKVKAGAFKTKHYRDKTPQGDTFDFWVSDKVFPFGLVKMEGEQKSNPAVKGTVKFELASTGSGAKAEITKPAKPFDQNVMMREVMGGKPGGAPAAAPTAPAKP